MRAVRTVSLLAASDLPGHRLRNRSPQTSRVRRSFGSEPATVCRSLQRAWWAAMLQLVKDPSQLDATLTSVLTRPRQLHKRFGRNERLLDLLL